MSYSGRDFASLESALRSYLEQNFPDSWQDFYKQNAGNLILNAVLWLLDNLNAFLDKQALETFLLTAETEESLHVLALQYGLRSYRKPSAGKLKFEQPIDITDKYINATYPLEVVNRIDETTYEVIQREIKEYSTTLGENGIIKLIMDNILEVVSVSINGRELKEGHAYKKGEFSVLPIWIMNQTWIVLRANFGDNITVFYYDTLADSANGVHHGEYNGVPYTLTLEGGRSKYDKEEIRQLAFQAYQSQDRLVTKQDFEYFVSLLPGVEKVRVYDVEDLDIDQIKYLVTKIVIKGGSVTYVKREIDRKRLLDSVIEVEEAIPLPISLRIKVFGDYIRAEQYIRQYFNNLNIGQPFIPDELVAYLATMGYGCIVYTDEVIPKYNEYIELAGITYET